MFSHDSPGVASPTPSPAEAECIGWQDCEEWIRVAFSARPTGTMSGSRASDKFLWHETQTLAQNAAGDWERVPHGDYNETADNEIGAGWGQIYRE